MELIDTADSGRVRSIAGTDFPITHAVYRDAVGRKKPVWILTTEICNGICHGESTSYRTCWKALRDLKRLVATPGGAR